MRRGPSRVARLLIWPESSAVEFVPFDTAGKLADAVKTGAWDVAFLGVEPQRAGEIAFTAAYLEIPVTYLVPAGSPIRSTADVDREGVRIAVADKSAYELYLTHTIKLATRMRAQGIEGSLDLFLSQRLEVLSGLKPRLLMDVEKLPGARPPRRPVHRRAASRRYPEGPPDRRQLPPPLRRGREGLWPGRRGHRAERREGRLRRTPRARSGVAGFRSWSAPSPG
jgi:hypothetical protein